MSKWKGGTFRDLCAHVLPKLVHGHVRHRLLGEPNLVVSFSRSFLYVDDWRVLYFHGGGIGVSGNLNGWRGTRSVCRCGSAGRDNRVFEVFSVDSNRDGGVGVLLVGSEDVLSAFGAAGLPLFLGEVCSLIVGAHGTRFISSGSFFKPAVGTLFCPFLCVEREISSTCDTGSVVGVFVARGTVRFPSLFSCGYGEGLETLLAYRHLRKRRHIRHSIVEFLAISCEHKPEPAPNC